MLVHQFYIFIHVVLITMCRFIYIVYQRTYIFNIYFEHFYQRYSSSICPSLLYVLEEYGILYCILALQGINQKIGSTLCHEGKSGSEVIYLDFSKDSLFKIIGELAQGGDISISDIPDIELYMDQVTTFMDNKLRYHKRTLKDKILTKTMINNYTKSKILLPSKNKRYNRQHMILLILIYYLKQILSINDISMLFTPLFKNMNSSQDDMEYLGNLYNSFLQVKEESSGDLKDKLTDKLKLIDSRVDSFPEESRETTRVLLTVLMLVVTASIQKSLAEKIIDEYLQIKK